MAEVRFEHVWKRFEGDVVAVRDFHLQVRDREFLVLVGPSGCGKSTSLRMLAGLEEITEGEIYIDDRVVNSLAPKERDIAMVFQSYALYPHMSVYDNMAFGLKLRKVPKAEIRKMIEEAAGLMQISDLLDRRPKQLSGGQRQRVAMGRAIVRAPKVFLFDEPLSNLDAKLRVQMRIEIQRLHGRLSTTTIYVTHDQVEAMTLADRMVVMKDGLIHQVGAPLEVYRRPANRFVAGFIGSPPTDFFEAEIQETALQARGLSWSLPPSWQQVLEGRRKVVVGIRPEAFTLSCDEATLPVSATAEVVEPMGAELYVYFNLGGETAVARLGTEREVEVGEPIELGVSSEAIYLFDPVSGETLTN